MAYKGKVVTNPKTGQQIRFLQTGNDTNGKLLEMESTIQPYSKEPPAHYYPAQDENFTVLEGELQVRINGRVQTLTKGQHVKIEANMVHAMWNKNDEQAVINWQVRPALDTKLFLKQLWGLLLIKKQTNQAYLACCTCR